MTETEARHYDASGLEILPCDNGWVVIIRLWDQVVTTVAETPERLRQVLDSIEWKPRGELDLQRVRRLREARQISGEGSGGQAEQAERVR